MLTGGATSFIFAASPTLVVKVAMEFDDPPPSLLALSHAALASVAREKKIYRLLDAHPHPNILRSLLRTTAGIFLPRLPTSLRARLELPPPAAPPPPHLQHRWIRQLASAAAWLESLALFHGDLQPANILLDSADHVQLCDFGSTTHRGAELLTATSPFYRPRPGDKPLRAGPETEQFAVGSCIYAIRTGAEPLAHLDGPAMVRALRAGEVPETEGDAVFGGIVARCWQGGYGALSGVERAVVEVLEGFGEENGGALAADGYEAGVKECYEFLELEGRFVQGDVPTYANFLRLGGH